MIGRKRMVGFPSLLPVEPAFNSLLKNVDIKQPRIKTVGLEDSLGRVCGEDIKSPVDVPDFDRSAVDGYAVRAEDTFGASPTNPIQLKLIGTIHAGDEVEKLPPLNQGEAIAVLTGAPIPRGANAVVMVEHSRREDNVIEVTRQVHPLQNISRRGEDFKKDDVVVKRGTVIKPWHIAALASLNITEVPIYEELKIAILSTGSEIVELGETPGRGKVVNSSKPMLKTLVREAGCRPIDLGTVPDDFEVIVDKIREGVRIGDMLLVTGGTSVGERDLVPEAVNRAGNPGVVFHGVKIRPAKPTGAGVVDGKPVFMLSGYPVSALIGFQLFVKPLIARFYQMPLEEPCRVRAVLSRRVANPVDNRSFVRVRVEKHGEKYVAEPLMHTGSGLISTLTRANAMLVIPEGVEGYEEGEEVEVIMLQPIEAAVK
ncbi:MAG TPA: molybdopterin molybdenumtransferase MoeA [Candidatus Caldiarchaeum subterraneum]|uniref:Molybdopterin molybdenumtransferase MoeA n=1 Tax=Caldiarchaeum subterraneum TaxID=311458 RepID=A0A833E9V2_CALS0|nr:molybdopterin molybdenumtransferase MoeA [Candidatus Caldarchaeum subterraneum]